MALMKNVLYMGDNERETCGLNDFFDWERKKMKRVVFILFCRTENIM